MNILAQPFSKHLYTLSHTHTHTHSLAHQRTPMHTPMHTHSQKHKVTEHQSQKIGGKSRKAKACSSEPTTEDLLTVSQVTNTSSDLTNSLKAEMNYVRGSWLKMISPVKREKFYFFSLSWSLVFFHPDAKVAKVVRRYIGASSFVQKDLFRSTKCKVQKRLKFVATLM